MYGTVSTSRSTSPVAGSSSSTVPLLLTDSTRSPHIWAPGQTLNAPSRSQSISPLLRVTARIEYLL